MWKAAITLSSEFSSSDSSSTSSFVTALPEPRPSSLLQFSNPRHPVRESIIQMDPFDLTQPLSATYHSSNAVDPYLDYTMLNRPPQVHVRERPSYEDPNSNTESNPTFDLRVVLKRRANEDKDSCSQKSSSTFHTAVLATSPEPIGLRRTDSIAALTSIQHPHHGNLKPTKSEALIQESNARQDHKLRLERARDEVRRLKSRNPKSTTHHDLPARASYFNREMDYQRSYPVLKNPKRNLWLLWSSIVILLAGMMLTAGLVGIIGTKKADRLEIGKWLLFLLVCSIVLVIVSALAVGGALLVNGNAGHAILDQLGLNEVRSLDDGDLERGRVGGLMGHGVGAGDATSTLGASRGGTRTQYLGRELSGPKDGASTTGSTKTAITDSARHDRIQDPKSKALYSNPPASRALPVARGTAPSIPSKLRYNISQDDPDLGAQRLFPTPAIVRGLAVSERRGRSRTARRRYREAEGFEMADLGGKGGRA